MTASNEVILYTKQRDCPGCVEAKRFLAERQVTYVEKDVEDRANLMELVKTYRIMSVPVLVVADKPIVGFKKEEYETALDL